MSVRYIFSSIVIGIAVWHFPTDSKKDGGKGVI